MKKSSIHFIGLLLWGCLSFLVLTQCRPEEKQKYRFEVLLKASDSTFWKYVEAGVNQFGREYSEKVEINLTSPPSERNLNQQLAMLDAIIASKPEAIILASISSTKPVDLIQKAKEAGIVVIGIDNQIETDLLDTIIATEQKEAGRRAADEFLRIMEEREISPQGTVAIIRSQKDAQVIIDRDLGFMERMREVHPGIHILDPIPIQSDIIKGTRVVESLLEEYGESLIGIFGDNNHTGVGAYVAVRAQEAYSPILVAFDADPEEVVGLEEGVIDALILQRPAEMGYRGCEAAYLVLQGETIPRVQESPIMVVRKEMLQDPMVQKILNPLENYQSER